MSGKNVCVTPDYEDMNIPLKKILNTSHDPRLKNTR